MRGHAIVAMGPGFLRLAGCLGFLAGAAEAQMSGSASYEAPAYGVVALAGETFGATYEGSASVGLGSLEFSASDAFVSVAGLLTPPYEAFFVAEDQGLDQGETVSLEPGNNGGGPAKEAEATITNVTAGDQASVVVIETESLSVQTDGFGVFGVSLVVETSMDDGEFFLTVTQPIASADLGGANPVLVDLAYYDEETGQWELAASGNTQNSPGFNSPVGDRFVEVDTELPSPPIPSTDLGDYGVFWNPAAGEGFVWANVDHTTAFNPGITGVFQYGCGINPETSLAPVDGTPSLGETITLGVDNPVGTSPLGSVALLLVSLTPDPMFPCGTQLPGWGMAGPKGELLISVLPPNPVAILGPVAWSGPGTFAEIAVPIPNDLDLLGLDLFLQGVMANVGSVKFSDGLRMTLSD